MALTPESMKAHEELDAAMKKVLALQGIKGDYPEPLLVDWIVVCEGVHYDDAGDSLGYYNLIFRGGQCRRSVALGLLDIGVELMDPED